MKFIKARKLNSYTLVSILFSSCITVSLIFFLFQTTSAEDWQSLFHQLNPSLLLLYIFLFVVSMMLRAFRYQLLLNASNLQLKVSFYIMLLTTFVKNLFVDLLPARLGSLSYVVLLNKKFKLPLSSCFSSFTLSIIFDFLGMAPLLCFAAIIGVGITKKSDPLWFVPLSIIILLISYMLFLYIDRLCYFLVKILDIFEQKILNVNFVKLNKIKEILNLTAYDINFIKEKKIFWKILTISVFIRVLKYGGLYVIILSFLPHDGKILLVNTFGWVFFGLIAAEASASMPISGIGGFGAYEWSLISVLSILGLDSSIAGVVSLGLHLLTQLIDYSLGGIALLVVMLHKNPQGRNYSSEDKISL